MQQGLTMSDNVDDPVLEQLRALPGGQDRIESELREVAARLASLGSDHRRWTTRQCPSASVSWPPPITC
jgi:hypothetical protein